jgi:hypothetical protein
VEGLRIWIALGWIKEEQKKLKVKIGSSLAKISDADGPGQSLECAA